MDIKKARRAIRMTARKEGISEMEVIRKIEAGISEAIDNARKSNDFESLKRWREIPCAGDVPNAYELVAYLGEKVYDHAKS